MQVVATPNGSGLPPPPLPPIDPELVTSNLLLITNMHAAATAEPLAVFVSFRWHLASLSPTQNVNSAEKSLTSACHFSGKYAICDLREYKFSYNILYASKNIPLSYCN